MKIGKVTENALKRSILKQIKTKREEVKVGAGLGGDCAIFSLNCGVFAGKNEDLGLISCMVSGELPIQNILQKAANTLAAREAKGVAVSIQLLLPLETEESVLKEIMVEAESFCKDLNLQIAQANAQVTGAVKVPYATVSMEGVACEDASKSSDDCKHVVARDEAENGSNKAKSGKTNVRKGTANREGERSPVTFHIVQTAKPGQDIVLSKWIGLEGTSILADECKDSILERYPSWVVNQAKEFVDYLSTVPEAAVAVKSGVCTMYNLGEGGILAALWELAEGAGVGLTIDLKKLPIRQETVEICNHLNVNPYELLSGGSLLMTTEDGNGLVNALEEAGIPATVVGKITDSNDKLIINEDETRFLDRPHPDSIYREAE